MRCERGSEERGGLEEGAEQHYGPEAVQTHEDGDEGRDEHGHAEVEAAEEGVVDGGGRGEEVVGEVVGEVDAVGLCGCQ